MSTYKLSPEDIRKRAREVAAQQSATTCENMILRLLEDATGEKVPEEFDESKVQHLSVWQWGIQTVVLLAQIDDFIGCYGNQTGYVSERDFTGTRERVVASLKSRDARYIGQYDFAAGLPKGNP